MSVWSDGGRSLSFGDRDARPPSEWLGGTIVEQNDDDGRPCIFRMVQQTNYTTKLPEYWPLKPGETTPRPKLQPVVRLQTTQRDDPADDGIRDLYVKMSKQPGGMSRVIDEAVRTAGAQKLEVGGELLIRWSHNAGDARAFEARYTRPRVDVFGSFDPAAPATPPVADTPQPAALAAALAAGLTPPQPDVLSQASALLAAGLTAENVALALKAQGHDIDAATIAALGNAR